MTVTIAYATLDGHISSYSSSSYTAARNGTGSFTVATGDATVSAGQDFTTPNWAVVQGFHRYPVSVPADERVTAAMFGMLVTEVTGSVVRALQIREYDWSTTLESADFRTGGSFGGLSMFGTVENVHTAAGKRIYVGGRTLATRLNAGASVISTVMTTNRAQLGTTPTGPELIRVAAAESSGTASDPVLVFTSAPVSHLFGTLGAQVRLADGSHMVVQTDGAAASPVINVRRHTAGGVTTVHTLGSDFATPSGMQSLGLATDGENVWVLGEHATQGNAVAIQRLSRTGPATFSADTVRAVTLPGYAGQVNAVAAVYHATATPVLSILVSHVPGSAIAGTLGAEIAWVTINANYHTDPATNVSWIAANTALDDLLPTGSEPDRFNTYGNEVGSGLDLVSVSASTGFLASFPKGAIPGEAKPIGMGRYDLNSNGTLATVGPLVSGNYGTKDAAGKVRMVPISGTAVAVVSADPVTGYGITVQPWQTGPGSWTALAPAVHLDAESIPSMPTAASLATSSAWDAVYTPYDNKVWIYYPDKTDPRILRRTGVSMSTYQASREEVTVTTAGSAGGTNLAVRVARNGDVGVTNTVTLAHRASGGALSTIYATDSFQQSPTAPVLTPKANYDATAAAVFAWTFTDPNSGDTQSAYQLQILTPDGASTVHDTGKVTSATASHNLAGGTLANGQSYQWRVRTYDQGDLVSPWSLAGTFSTSASGTVTITDPAVDNPPGIVTDDYLIKWSVSGTTQAAYRYRRIRTSDSAVITDSGWVTSTVTQRLVTAMASDVEYRIEITVRNAALVESGTGTRLITPSFSTPDVPNLNVEDRGAEGHILLTVDNPEPTGDRPTPTGNTIYRRPAGTVEWSPIGTCPPDGTFKDYTASARVPYEYMVRAVA